MKIAITGGTAGIGQALADIYEIQGHEVLRLSRRTGHNIRSTPKVADVIENCDVFINNAQSGFAQTELLFEMCQRWAGKNKTIVSISTMMTQVPVSSLPGVDMDLYRIQKLALEESVSQLRHKKLGIQIILVRPGKLDTTDEIVRWANKLTSIMDISDPFMSVTDISLGPVN